MSAAELKEHVRQYVSEQYPGELCPRSAAVVIDLGVGVTPEILPVTFPSYLAKRSLSESLPGLGHTERAGMV
jgi:hypothetical protein